MYRHFMILAKRVNMDAEPCQNCPNDNQYQSAVFLKDECKISYPSFQPIFIATHNIDATQNPTALNTADFIGKLNDIFDGLNSKYLDDPNPMRRPGRVQITNN